MTTPAQEAGFWDRCAGDPDLSRKWLCGEPELTEATVGLISEWMPDGGYVYDVGCGDGRLAVALAEARPDLTVVGLDISIEVLAQRKPFPAGGWYEQIDGRSVPENPHDPIDGAYSVALFQHLPPAAVQSYYQSVYRALKPGAVFVAQFAYSDDRSHHRDFDHVYSSFHASSLASYGGFHGQKAWEDIQPGWLWIAARKPE